MARFLIIVLLALLPFQFVWGAAASYCQHEQGASVSHFGHHTHKHQSKALKSFGESTPDKKTGVADEDFDCEYCHLSCAQSLVSVSLQCATQAMPQFPADNVDDDYSSHVPVLIDRPKWTLAA